MSFFFFCQKKQQLSSNEQQRPPALRFNAEVFKDHEFSGLRTVGELMNA